MCRCWLSLDQNKIKLNILVERVTLKSFHLVFLHASQHNFNRWRIIIINWIQWKDCWHITYSKMKMKHMVHSIQYMCDERLRILRMNLLSPFNSSFALFFLLLSFFSNNWYHHLINFISIQIEKSVKYRRTDAHIPDNQYLLHFYLYNSITLRSLRWSNKTKQKKTKNIASSFIRFRFFSFVQLFMSSSQYRGIFAYFLHESHSIRMSFIYCSSFSAQFPYFFFMNRWNVRKWKCAQQYNKRKHL